MAELPSEKDSGMAPTGGTDPSDRFGRPAPAGTHHEDSDDVGKDNESHLASQPRGGIATSPQASDMHNRSPAASQRTGSGMPKTSGSEPSTTRGDPKSKGKQGHGEPTRDNLRNQEEAGSPGGHSNDSNASKGEGAGGLKSAEEGDSFYNPKNDDEDYKKRRLEFLISKKTRKYFLGGGIVATIVVTAMLFLASGPFEFVHIAQLLEKWHFSALSDQSNDRFLQQVRFFHFKMKGKAYRSNLGVFKNAVADNLEAKLSTVGIEPAYNNGTFGVSRDGFYVDPAKLAASDSADFAGKTPEQIKQAIEAESPGVKFQDITSGERAGQIFVDETGLNSQLFGHFQFTKTSRIFLKASGMNKVNSSLGARLLSKRAGSTWHPISRARNIAISKFINWVKGWIFSSEKGTTESISKTGEAVNDPAITAEATAFEEEGVSSKLGGINESSAGTDNPQTKEGASLKAKLTGGGLAALTVLCQLKSLDSEATNIKRVQVAYPLVRETGTMIGIGNQVMSGQDLTSKQVGFMKKFLDGPSLQTNDPNKITSWDQAQSIQAEMGNPNYASYVKPSSTLTDLNKNSPFHVLNTGTQAVVLGGPCGALNSLVGKIVGVLTAPELSAVTYFVTQLSVVKNLIDEAVLWIAGQPLNPLDRGADFGNNINYGARLAANYQAVSAGGRQLSTSESSQLTAFEAQQSQQEFQNHSLAYRIFNPYDANTAISKLIDSQSTQPGQELHNIASAVFNFGHIFSSISNLFNAKALAAATPINYNYGFPQYGFSTSEMNNPLVKNPYKNAEDVVNTILPNHPEYIQMAQECFDVTIDPVTYNVTSLGNSEINPNSPQAANMNFYQQPGSAGYNAACADKSSDWMQLRFYIFDTQTMATTDCYLGNANSSDTQKACDMTGNTQSSSNSASTSTGNGVNNPGGTGSGGNTGPASGSCKNGGQYSALVGSGANFMGYDQGIDFTPKSSAGYNICAPASGTITLADQTGHTFQRTNGTALVIEKLDKTPGVSNSSRYVYFAELVNIAKNLKVGTKVNKGDLIGTNNQNPGIETGWGTDATHGFLCTLGTTTCGYSFYNWIVAGGG